MVDFRKLIAPKSAKRVAGEISALLHFQKLDAAGQAAALLEQSRILKNSGCFKSDPVWSYDEWALYRVIPAIARKLDPEIELEADEIPDRNTDLKDPVASVVEADLDKLVSHAMSVASNTQFNRAMHAEDGQVRTAAAIMGLYTPCMLSLAADTLKPGTQPKRHEVDSRPRLEGFFIILEGEHDRDVSLCYCKNREDAEEVLTAALKYLGGEDTSSKLEQHRASIRQLQSLLISKPDHVRLSIQDADAIELAAGEWFNPTVGSSVLPNSDDDADYSPA